MIKIVIGGDICPINRNENLFRIGKANSIFPGLLEYLNSADLTIVNLECPLVDTPSPIKKNGPNLGVPSECINGIKNAGIKVVNLANNHILDHGEQGLKKTINTLKKVNIDFVGAGRNLKDARKIKIYEIKERRIGILAMAEHEFSLATDTTWGANPLDIIDFVGNLNENRNLFDYLIILIHAGVSGYPTPSPNFMKIAHFLVDVGANLVVFQHSHIPGSYEFYKGGYIFYGQGNLIFDWSPPIRGSSWNNGFIISIKLSDDLKCTFELVPYIQSDHFPGAHILCKNKKKKFLEDVTKRSNAIKDIAYIQRSWKEYCISVRGRYYSNMLFGNNRLLNFISNKFNFKDLLLNKKHLLIWENFITCETHREILETLFELEKK